MIVMMDLHLQVQLKDDISEAHLKSKQPKAPDLVGSHDC